MLYFMVLIIEILLNPKPRACIKYLGDLGIIYYFTNLRKRVMKNDKTTVTFNLQLQFILNDVECFNGISLLFYHNNIVSIIALNELKLNRILVNICQDFLRF